MEIELQKAEVKLQKTKITNTILKQTYSISLTDGKELGYEILGWCIYNNKKTVILYNYQLNTLRIAENLSSVNYEIITYENEENSYINDRLLEIEERIGKYHLKTVVGGKTLYSIYLTKEEAKNMYDNGIEFIKIINEKGQIYI
ncbi:hypothetical protein [Algoriella sp.]|uniref:hypothetical protein n=1 Tax=Algoriella sp. TaxID=1872434 RepID=UPI002FCA06A5